jgi:aconitate hydratase
VSLNSFGARDRLVVDGESYDIFRLDRVQTSHRLPYSLRVLLENVVRNEDGRLVTGEQVAALAAWNPMQQSHTEIQFTPARGVDAGFHRCPVRGRPGRDA